MPFLSWEEYVFSRNAQNNLDGRLVTFSKAFRETALPLILFCLTNLVLHFILIIVTVPIIRKDVIYA